MGGHSIEDNVTRVDPAGILHHKFAVALPPLSPSDVSPRHAQIIIRGAADDAAQQALACDNDDDGRHRVIGPLLMALPNGPPDRHSCHTTVVCSGFGDRHAASPTLQLLNCIQGSSTSAAAFMLRLCAVRLDAARDDAHGFSIEPSSHHHQPPPPSPSASAFILSLLQPRLLLAHLAILVVFDSVLHRRKPPASRS